MYWKQTFLFFLIAAFLSCNTKQQQSPTTNSKETKIDSSLYWYLKAKQNKLTLKDNLSFFMTLTFKLIFIVAK